MGLSEKLGNSLLWVCMTFRLEQEGSNNGNEEWCIFYSERRDNSVTKMFFALFLHILHWVVFCLVYFKKSIYCLLVYFKWFCRNILFKYLSLNVFGIKFMIYGLIVVMLNFLVSKVQFVLKSEFSGTINFWLGVGLLHKNHFNLEFENKWINYCWFKNMCQWSGARGSWIKVFSLFSDVSIKDIQPTTHFDVCRTAEW